jgi:hypothetical protein
VFTSYIPPNSGMDPDDQPYSQRGIDPKFPAKPFEDWLRALVRRHDSVKEVAELIGYREKSIADFLNGDRTTVKLSVADACLTRYDGDMTVRDLWPERF